LASSSAKPTEAAKPARASLTAGRCGGIRRARRLRRGAVRGSEGFLVRRFHLGCGRLGGLFDGGIENPPRERKRNRPGHFFRVLHHGHADRDHPLLVNFLRLDEIDPFGPVIQRHAAQRRRLVDAGGQGAHFRFAIKLSSGQVAGLSRVARAQANQLANHGQRPAKNGDSQDHFEQRETAATAFGSHQCCSRITGLPGP
jgi:hypothetical protein